MTNSTLTATASAGDYNAKDVVRGIIETLPDNCSLEDIMLELYIHASILDSRQQIAAGRGLSLQEARTELNLWFTSRSLQNSSPN